MTMTARDLRRSLLVLLARWIKAWAERLLAEDASAAPPPAAEELEVPLHAGGPPAHWVERVRQGAPELLIGLDLPRPARPRPPPDTPAPGRVAEETRATHHGAPPAWAHRVDPRPATSSPKPGVVPAPEGRLPTPPGPAVAAPPPPAPTPPAPSFLTSAATAGARDVPGAGPSLGANPARPGPHRVLRWSEHTRRRELERRPPRRPEPPAATAPGGQAYPEPRPEPRPEDGQPDWALPPFQEPSPSVPADRPGPEEPPAGAAPEPWPELLPEAPPGEEEEELLRRLERQRRIAREQRGE